MNVRRFLAHQVDLVCDYRKSVKSFRVDSEWTGRRMGSL